MLFIQNSPIEHHPKQLWLISPNRTNNITPQYKHINCECVVFNQNSYKQLINNKHKTKPHPKLQPNW